MANQTVEKIGFWAVVSLVIGSQVGSGAFLLPAQLAGLGAMSLAGWFLAGAGAISIALIFAQLCMHIPKSGGPHAYVEAAFGKRFSFFTSWTYWVVSWISTSVVIITAVSYMTPLIGVQPPFVLFLIEVAIMAIITYLNFKGVAAAGSIEILLTIFKCLPLIIIPLSAFFFFNPEHFVFVTAVLDGSTGSIFSLINKASLLCLWGFVGVETATITAGVIENPRVVVPKAVIFGTIAVAVLYILNTVGLMGLIPLDQLAVSNAPHADAVRIIFGQGFDKLIAFIAAVACIGTVNAWTLMSAQMAYSAAQDGVFPPLFAKTNKNGAPIINLLISFFGTIPLLALAMNSSLLMQLDTLITISGATFLSIYALCMIAYLKLYGLKNVFYGIIALGALLFCAWALSAAPLSHLGICLLFTATGLPIYWWNKRARKLA
ncbi:amino acid permease [bacterium]|nr:amino acid permease [bacterium]